MEDLLPPTRVSTLYRSRLHFPEEPITPLPPISPLIHLSDTTLVVLSACPDPDSTFVYRTTPISRSLLLKHSIYAAHHLTPEISELRLPSGSATPTSLNNVHGLFAMLADEKENGRTGIKFKEAVWAYRTLSVLEWKAMADKEYEKLSKYILEKPDVKDEDLDIVWDVLEPGERLWWDVVDRFGWRGEAVKQRFETLGVSRLGTEKRRGIEGWVDEMEDFFESERLRSHKRYVELEKFGDCEWQKRLVEEGTSGSQC
ncbi:hypothetical protein M501DRAFT_1013085 [Patellaria atrata CBS 101060]|uniref:Uncharacterized protein n=1 Tax=Patellaria atrata CBS 101060 TaxID=1346257 RepID=A0A9P4VXF1_9PEZI|nr:hypothetical protein M501DRAFT_1013085 [Patellaria atrata CBS 101060]